MPIADLPPPPPAIETSAFDLATIEGGERIDLRAVKPRCPTARAGEIVVCAPDPEKERARPLPETYAVREGLPKAELKVSDSISLDVHGETAGVGGFVSNRVMVGAKIKF